MSFQSILVGLPQICRLLQPHTMQREALENKNQGRAVISPFTQHLSFKDCSVPCSPCKWETTISQLTLQTYFISCYAEPQEPTVLKEISPEGRLPLRYQHADGLLRCTAGLLACCTESKESCSNLPRSAEEECKGFSTHRPQLER